MRAQAETGFGIEMKNVSLVFPSRVSVGVAVAHAMIVRSAKLC